MTEKAHCEVCGNFMGMKQFIGKRKTCSQVCRNKKYLKNKKVKEEK